MAPDPFLGTSEEFLKGDWLEAVQAVRPSGPNMFSQTSADVGLSGIKINAGKTRGCLRYCLGYNAVQAASTGVVSRLLRTNPVPHPRYPFTFCTSASEQELIPDASGTGPGNRGLKVEANPPIFSTGTPPHVLGSGFSQGSRADYRYANISLRFEPLPYQLLQDESITESWDEYKRNTFIDQDPRAEILSLTGFRMIYAEGTGLVAPNSSPEGKEYPADVGQVLVKSDLRITWTLVPEEWIMYPGTSKPTRILFRLGCVNSTDFLGYEAGTLALMGLKLTKYPWPMYQPNPSGVLPQESKYVYTVELLMSFFDPEKGYTGDPPVQITSNKGWNNFPYRGITGTDVNAGKWFLATYDGWSLGQRLFDEVDFKKCFDGAQNGPASGL